MKKHNIKSAKVYEFKYKLKKKHEWKTITYYKLKDLHNNIISFREGYGRIDNQRIKNYDAFYDIKILKIETNNNELKTTNITEKKCKALSFETKIIYEVKFSKDGTTIINGKKFILGGISGDVLKLLSSFFKGSNRNYITVTDLLYYRGGSLSVCVGSPIIRDLIHERIYFYDISKENLRKTYIKTINKNVAKLYPNQRILDMNKQLIQAIIYINR